MSDELRERIAKAIDDARMWALVTGINRDDEDEREQEALAMADAALAVIAETHERHPLGTGERVTVARPGSGRRIDLTQGTYRLTYDNDAKHWTLVDLGEPRSGERSER